MQLKQDEKPFGSFFGISLWMRSVSLRGAGRRGQKRCKDSARREKNEERKKLESFVFLLPFGVYSDKTITFAIRMDGTALPLFCYIVG